MSGHSKVFLFLANIIGITGETTADMRDMHRPDS